MNHQIQNIISNLICDLRVVVDFMFGNVTLKPSYNTIQNGAFYSKRDGGCGCGEGCGCGDDCDC